MVPFATIALEYERPCSFLKAQVSKFYSEMKQNLVLLNHETLSLLGILNFLLRFEALSIRRNIKISLKIRGATSFASRIISC